MKARKKKQARKPRTPKPRVLEIECPLERILLLQALNAKIGEIVCLQENNELDEYRDEKSFLPYLRSLRNRLEVL